MKVIVLGASGFIGRNFLLQAPKNWEIVGTYNSDETFTGFIEKNKLDNVTPIKCNFLNEHDIEELFTKCDNDFDVCYHFAATTPFSISKYTGLEDIKMIFTLKKFFSKGCIKRFVFPSSYIIYGEADEYPIKENTPLNPNSLYGANKASCEKYLQFFLSEYNIPFVFLRGSCVMNEFQTHGFILSCVEKAINRGKIYIYDPKEKRDNIYLHDFIDTLIIASVKGSGIYNIGSGKSYKVKEIAEMIVEKVGHGEVETLNQKSKLSNNLLDISKARDELDFTPKTSLHEALTKIIKYKKRYSKESINCFEPGTKYGQN